MGIRPIKKAHIFSVLDIMVLPGVIYIIINNYIPMAGILIAFKKVDYAKGIFHSDWIGWENFKYLFSTKDAFVITRNTILYNLVFIVLGTMLGLLVGIFLSEIASKAFQKVYQTIILLPQLFSIIIIAYIVLAFLSNEAGFINKSVLGEGRAVNFYSDPGYWPFIITAVYLWKGLGYNSIIYLSAIVSVDRNLYEAATVDGVGKFKQIFHVTIPCIKPTIVTLVLISVGRIFYSDFGLFYQVPMNSGSLFPVTNTIDTYVYRSLLQLNNIGMASAAGSYQAVVGFLIIIIVNGIVRMVDKDNAMF
jgi:putative aldouronate transport system permease protein